VGAIAGHSCLTRGQNAARCDQRWRGSARRSPRRDQRSLGCVKKSVRRDQRALDEDQRVAMVDGLLIAHLPLDVSLAQSPPRSLDHPRERRTDTPSSRRGASHSFERSKTPRAWPMPPRQRLRRRTRKRSRQRQRQSRRSARRPEATASHCSFAIVPRRRDRTRNSVAKFSGLKDRIDD
jgi:hypothetical protein